MRPHSMFRVRLIIHFICSIWAKDIASCFSRVEHPNSYYPACPWCRSRYDASKTKKLLFDRTPTLPGVELANSLVEQIALAIVNEAGVDTPEMISSLNSLSQLVIEGGEPDERVRPLHNSRDARPC